MNIQSKINKLILALKVKGRIVGINTRQFYAEDSKKMITKYEMGEISEAAEADKRVMQVLYRKMNSKRTTEEEKEEISRELEYLQEEFEEKYISGIFYSKIKILMFLAEWHKKVGEET